MNINYKVPIGMKSKSLNSKEGFRIEEQLIDPNSRNYE